MSAARQTAPGVCQLNLDFKYAEMAPFLLRAGASTNFHDSHASARVIGKAIRKSVFALILPAIKITACLTGNPYKYRPYEKSPYFAKRCTLNVVSNAMASNEYESAA